MEAAPRSEDMTGADLAVLLVGDVRTIAPGLLGYRVRTEFDGRPTEVVLTDVEAYGGADDPASHAYRGRTARNDSMFGPPGTLYVFRSYGIHWCMNVVVGPAGTPAAVLLRGGAPRVGMEVMAGRRGRTDHLTDGPGKLGQALGVDGSVDGSSLADGPVRLLEPQHPVRGRVTASARIGVSRGTSRKWRFAVTGTQTAG